MTSSPPQGPWDDPSSGQPYGGGWESGGLLPQYPGGGASEEQWAGSPNNQLAGWWYRVGATVIDGILVGIVGLVFQLALGRVAGDVIGGVVNAVYQIVLVGGRGQTVGCMAVGTRVVSADGSPQIGYRRAALRWITPVGLAILLIIPALLDFLWPLWDDRNQTLHDKAANTLVARVR